MTRSDVIENNNQDGLTIQLWWIKSINNSVVKIKIIVKNIINTIIIVDTVYLRVSIHGIILFLNKEKVYFL